MAQKNNNNNKKAEELAKAEQAKKAEELAKVKEPKVKKYKVKEHIFPNQKSRNYFIDGKNVTLTCGEEVDRDIVSKFPSWEIYFEEI